MGSAAFLLKQPLVIYGLGGNAKDAMRYSKYGINAMFHEPLERPAALKLVRATQMLVLHEFRRYVRISLMTEVSIVSNDGRRLSASSLEVSSGGMSVKCSEDLSAGTNVEVSFALLTLPRVWIRGAVSWKKPKSFGVRFEAADERRQKLKAWIDGYLENCLRSSFARSAVLGEVRITMALCPKPPQAKLPPREKQNPARAASLSASASFCASSSAPAIG